MKKRKIIHIYRRDYNSYFPQKDSEYYYLAGWSSAVARQTVRIDNKYTVECWRPDREIKKILVLNVQGIICRLFPAKHIRFFGDWSFSLLKELKKQSKGSEIIIHHSSIHNYLLYLIAILFPHVPIVAQHHGDRPALAVFPRRKKFVSIVINYIEKKSLKNIDHLFVLDKKEMEFLSKLIPRFRIGLQTMGVDFDKFKPVNKKKAREKLDLPEGKKIMLYIGKFYRLKGVDVILRTFQDLKRKYDIELILIGGSCSDPLYEEMKASGAKCFKYISHNNLPLFYSAADVYLLPSFSLDYAGGIGVAVIESLACGVPVVSTTLKYFPKNELHKVGKIPRDENDVERCVSEILENPSDYSNCRNVAKNVFSWEKIIKNTVHIYDKLFKEYYS